MPTSVPEDIAEKAHLNKDEAQMQSPYGFNGDGRNIEPGATANDLMKTLAQDYNSYYMINWKKAKLLQLCVMYFLKWHYLAQEY